MKLQFNFEIPCIKEFFSLYHQLVATVITQMNASVTLDLEEETVIFVSGSVTSLLQLQKC